MVEGSKQCPECGKGTLLDITYREGRAAGTDAEVQSPETRQVETYSCGHEVIGPRLDATASEGAMEVERRTADETVEPLEGGSEPV